MKRFLLALGFVLAAAACSPPAPEPEAPAAPVEAPAPAAGLTIEQPVATPISPPRPGAVYLRIVNPGAEPDRLLAAASPLAEAIELHTHEMGEGGMMRMMKIDAIDVPAAGAAELKPGGLHLMVFGVKEPLAEGAALPLTLTFERAGAVEVTATVAQPKPGGGH